MSHIEPMDVDSITNEFDDKENTLQNSNVLSRTPSTEKGYEELDVSELNMKLRYSMTPATSPMSRSFTANCRESKMCDNENNSINTMFNDNSNLTNSFNSTITDSILKSSKFPLQVLPTEQFVDGNGNPIVRSLDVECNDVTITVSETDNIDDNLSLPSTSSSLAHTPEATTPTKEIIKDGGSPIMRGLKSVLNMFRSSQSPIPSDDITTNDLSSFESQKKDEASNFTTNLGSTPTTTNKNKENISKTNSPLKGRLVFNEDLEKELLWKDETTILFKEEKIPIYKLFFPSNSAALESTNSIPIDKENMNTAGEQMDSSFNETVIADKGMIEIVKMSSLESEILNSPESDCEFVDCETSFNKNDTRIFNDNVPALSPFIKNISPEFSITNEQTFQQNEIVEDENTISIMDSTDLTIETIAILSNTHDVIKEADSDENLKQISPNHLPILKESLDQNNILSNSLKEDISNDLTDKGNTIVYENVNELVQCSNETFNSKKFSEIIVSQIGKEYNNDVVNISDNIDNDASVKAFEEGKEDSKEFYPSQITKEIEKRISGELVCHFDSTVSLNEQTLTKQTDTLKINNIKLPACSEIVNEVKMDLGVLQDEIIISTYKNMVIPLVKSENELNVDNKCNFKLDSEINEDPILNQNHNNETDTFILSDQIIQQETKEIKTVNNNLPSDIPLPHDSDIDKDNLQDINEENLRENDQSVNYSSSNLNFDLSYSTESINQTIDGMISATETRSETILYPVINNVVANTSIKQTSQLALSEEITDIKKNVTVNEGDILKVEINNTQKCIPTVVGDTKEISSKINNSEIFPSNNNYSVSGIDLDDLTHHTQNNQNLISQNHDRFVQTSKSTDVEKEIESMNDVKLSYDEISVSSTNNKTSVTGKELDVSNHDSEDSGNPFETKNKLTESLEVQHCDSVIGDVFLQNDVESVPTVADDKNYSTNEIDVRVKYDAVNIPLANLNTSVNRIVIDVPRHDSENDGNPIKSRNILMTAFEIRGRDSDIQGVVGKKSIESDDTILNDKNEIAIKSYVKIKEEVNLPSTLNNSLVTEMELDVSKPDLEDSRSPIGTKKQLESSPEEQDREYIIENSIAKKYLENICLNDYNEITSENDLKFKEVICNPANSNNSETEMELDVSRHDLIGSENISKALCRDRDIKDYEIVKSDFESIPGLPDERVKFTSKIDVTISDEIIFPLTKNISSEINLGVSKYDEDSIEKTFEAKGFIPSSPQVSSKFTQDGNSINFDEIDDPFTTKINSATSNISNDDFFNTERSKIITEYKKRPQPSRRKTLHDQKKSNVPKEGANASFDCVLKDNEIINSCEENLKIQEIYEKDGEKQDYIENNMNSALSTSDKLQDDIEIHIPRDCTFLEQTKNYVEDAEINLSDKISSPSTEIYESRNVFNLPEIGDMNFKPFATKSEINDNQSTSSGLRYNTVERTDIEIARTVPEKNNVQDLEPNLSPNLSNITCSSKNADDITSLREVHTEDEDTVEGPFLEAEDFSDIVKVADFETEKDMMNFEDLPTRTDDDNENGEFFIDAEAFEFLLNQNKSNVVTDCGKESLFLKFDPLFAKRISSDGVLAALNKIKKRQSTPKKLTPLKIMHEENPTPGPSTTTSIGSAAPVATHVVEEPVAAISKPMMVVNPAIASFGLPRKSTTPPRVNRRSLTVTSPAMAVIDRLLSLSGNNSTLDQESSLPQCREYNETDMALTQLRELLADKEIHVHNLRSESKELKERFAILESQVRTLESESEERLRKIKELNEHLAEKNKINKSMAIVVEEYERTIASLISEMEQEKKQNAEERMKLINERDEQTAHLTSMEVSFSDLHSKYEKSKQIILSMKANEDTYKKSLNEFEVNLLKMQTNYDLLKQHATSKLNHANQELEKYNRAHDAEVLKLNAMIKRKELHITSLEESLSQKTKANEELTAICDELINKVG